MPVVRQVLAGLADAIELLPADLSDIATAVTEACNNAAAHAYAGNDGRLEVVLLAAGSAVAATVRDWGVGLTLDGSYPIDFPTDVDNELRGIGLPSIQGLATRARWHTPDGGGTAVEMVFSTTSPVWAGADPPRDGPSAHAVDAADLPTTIAVAMAPRSVARGVLPRLLRAMAARARFSLERHADVQRVCSAVLAEPSSRAAPDRIDARVTNDADWLEVALGPLDSADASRIADEVCSVEPTALTSVFRSDGVATRLAVRLRRSCQ